MFAFTIKLCSYRINYIIFYLFLFYLFSFLKLSDIVGVNVYSVMGFRLT